MKSGDSWPAWILRELVTIEVPMWPGITTRALDVRRVHVEVGLQRLAETLHRELGGAVGGVRHRRADRRLKPM